MTSDADHWHRMFVSTGGLEGSLQRTGVGGGHATRADAEEVVAAGHGAGTWPTGLVWRQAGRRVSWPCLFVGDTSGTTFVDAKGEALLRELLPEGGWDTVEAVAIRFDGEASSSYRLLRTHRLIPRTVVIDPILGDDVATVSDDIGHSPGIGRLAHQDGDRGQTLCVSPQVAAKLHRARRTRGSRLAGLEMGTLPWTSEIRR